MGAIIGSFIKLFITIIKTPIGLLLFIIFLIILGLRNKNKKETNKEDKPTI